MSDDSWKQEDDARTLQRAGEIMCDPERMKGAQKFLKKQKKAIKSITDIVDYRNDKYGPGAKDEDDE